MSGKAPIYKWNKKSIARKGKYCLGICFIFRTIFGVAFAQDQSPDLPILESSYIELLCSEQGIIKYRLFTDKVLHYSNGDKAYPEGIHIEFYTSNKEVLWIGRANYVYFFAKNNLYEFRVDVEIKNLRDKKQLNTDELYWITEDATIYTDRFIRIETEEEELLTGEGFTAKQDLSYYAISKPQGQINVQPTQ